MTFASLLTQDVEVLARTVTGRDSFGGEVVEFGPAEPAVAYVEQTDTVEVPSGQDVVRADWLFVFLPDVIVAPLDRITYDGKTFEVVGEPFPVYEPGVGVHHLEVRCRTGVVESEAS